MTYFDAGEMGCATGLTTEFRRRIQSVDLGHLLEVVVHDASAKVDLPSLARMMGHRVRSSGTRQDGAGVVVVERAR
jgi:TusA-related sulfurtransferase